MNILTGKKCLVFTCQQHHLIKLLDIIRALQKKGTEITYATSQNYNDDFSGDFELPLRDRNIPYIFIHDYLNSSTLGNIRRELGENISFLKDLHDKADTTHYSCMTDIGINNAIYELAENTILMEIIIDEVKPDFILVLHEANFWTKLIAYIAHKRLIPVVSTQEGHYSNNTTENYMNVRVITEFSDLLLAWGSLIKAKMDNYTNSVHKIKVVGASYTDSLLKRLSCFDKLSFISTLGLDQNRITFSLFLAYSMYNFDGIIKWFKNMVASFSAQGIIKFRATRDLNKFIRCKNTYEDTNIKFFFNEDPYEIISASDYVITGNSSIGLEALMLKKPFFYIFSDDDTYGYSHIALGVLNLSSSDAINNDTIADIINNFDEINYWNKVDHYLFERFYRLDGMATERSVQAIQDLLQERGGVSKSNSSCIKEKHQQGTCITITGSPLNFPLISIIIPTYNRSNILQKCLNAIAKQTFPLNRIEVFICDDGSTDDTSAVVQAFESPFKLIYLHQHNRGPAAARNMGIRRAIGEYLLILNDDAILEPNAVELHCKQQIDNQDKKIAVLGKFSFPPEFTEHSFWGYILEHTDALFYYYRMLDGETYDFRHFYTCNISIRRDAVVEAGLFDEDFTGPAAEDIELGYRLWQKGYRVLYSPEIIAWHDHIISPEGFLNTNKVRGQGAVTLMVKQPQAPFYPDIDFSDTLQMHEQCQREREVVDQIIKKINAFENSLPNDCDKNILKVVTENLMPEIKFLMRHATALGMLSNPLLPKLTELRTGKIRSVDLTNNALKKQPLISVVIPCYNYGRYLTEAVMSVINQTFQDFEIIIVNDGSTDNTRELAEKLIVWFPRYSIRLINQENSGQPAIPRNNGIRSSKGEFILCLDADDILSPDALENYVIAAANATQQNIVVYGWVQKFGVKVDCWKTYPFEINTLLRRNQVPSASFYHRNVWERNGGYAEKPKEYEDWDFWIAAAENGTTFINIQKITYYYRETESSSLQDIGRKKHEWNMAQIITNHPNIYEPEEVAWASDYLVKHHYPPDTKSIHRPCEPFPLAVSLLVSSYPELYSKEEVAWTESFLKHSAHTFTRGVNTKNLLPSKSNKDAFKHLQRGFDLLKEHLFADAQNEVRLYRELVDYNLLQRTDNRIELIPRISVVVVAYRTGQSLIQCLSSLAGPVSVPHEIIVVDNGGNEDIEVELANHSVLHVRVGFNVNPAEGRNIGVYFAKAPIICFVDDDAIVAEGYLASVILAFEKYDIHAFRGKVLPKTSDPNNDKAHHYDLGNLPIPSVINTEGNSAFRADILQELGGQEPLLFGGEGLELSYRICKAHGYLKIIYWPLAVIYHDYAALPGKLEEKHERHALMEDYSTYKHPDILTYYSYLQFFNKTDLARRKGYELLHRKDE